MNPVVATFDIVSLVATLGALVILAVGWRRALTRDAGALLAGFLLLVFLTGISNVLEWSGVTAELDPLEDFFDLLEPLLFGFFLYAAFQEMSKHDSYLQRLLAEALRDTAAALSSTLEIDEVLERILSSVGQVVQHDSANVMLIEAGVARVVGCVGYPDSEHVDRIMSLRFKVADMPTFRQMADTGKPLIIPDIQSYPGWVDYPETRWVRSYAGAPISLEGEIIGFINLNNGQPGAFTSVHAEHLRAFADQSAVAIRNARLYEQRQLYAAQLEALHGVTLDITAQLDLSTLLDALVQSAVKLLGGEAGGIYLYDPDRDVLVLEVAPPPDVSLLGSELKRGEGLSGKVLERGEPIFVDNYSEWEGRARAYGDYSWAAVVAAPIMWGEEWLGVIYVYHIMPDRTFGEANARLLSLFAAQASIAIYNARMYRGLEAYSELLEQAVARRTDELSAARERAEAILASVGDQVVVTDLEGHILIVNASFEQHTGFSAQDIAGRRFRTLAAEETKAVFEEMEAAAGRREDWSGELRIRRRDGSAYDAHVTVAPIRTRDDQVVGFVSSMHDITARKEVERLKNEFIANVSHELRTPLASLKLYHHLLVARPEKRDSYIATLNRETERLARIVETLLYLSRMDREQPPLELGLVDLNVLAGQYVSDRKPLAEERGLTLNFVADPGLPMIEVDAELLGQASSILLTNALNYTPAGGRVTVTTTLREERDGTQWVVLAVSDTGPGIAADEMERLFERFFRGKAGREAGVPGSGLGLAIAHQIVERHGGRISVMSEGVPGKGATFEIWLPLVRRAEAEK